MMRLTIAFISLCISLCVVGCPGVQRRPTPFDTQRPPSTFDDQQSGKQDSKGPPPLTLERRELTVELEVKGGAARLNATAVLPQLDGEGVTGPVVVIVPGASDISRRGLRRGDGVSTYRAPVAVTTAWQEALGAAGALSLAYDKRTCGKNDDSECHNNPQSDLDEQGPVALAKDVDAACAVAKTLPGFDGRLVLMAHGQATQVALSSTCAAEAKGIVLLNPIPRAIDGVLVDALQERHQHKAAAAKKLPLEQRKPVEDEATTLRNLAASRQASFDSMRAGKFAKDARVDGATIAFWLGWIDLTDKTTALADAVKDKTLVIVAKGDQQLSSADKDKARALPAKHMHNVDADHHLLSQPEGAAAPMLLPATSAPIIDALVAMLAPASS